MQALRCNGPWNLQGACALFTTTFQRILTTGNTWMPSYSFRAVILLATLAFTRVAQRAQPLSDFSHSNTPAQLRVIHDAVMGAAPTAGLSPGEDAITFESVHVLANNGGFASFGGSLRIPAQAKTLLLTVRGDAKRYKFTLRLHDAYATGQYQVALQSTHAWHTLRC